MRSNSLGFCGPSAVNSSKMTNMQNQAKYVGLLGKGKTGGKVLELLRQRGYKVAIFDSTHPPTASNLANLQALIAFVPGPVLLPYLPLLQNARLPLISGATGITWPEGICANVKNRELTWITANNFSLGMVVVKATLEALARARQILPDSKASIHEIHHTKKLDSPSGTALSWRQWLGPGYETTPITSAREGDVVGFHQFTLKTTSEQIQLTHEALDRGLFAQGAVWSLEQILANRLAPGVHRFEDIATEFLFKGQV